MSGDESIKSEGDVNAGGMGAGSMSAGSVISGNTIEGRASAVGGVRQKRE